MDERRNTVRQRSYLGGRIAFNARSSTMDCLVRNLTPHGAKLALSDAVTLPQELDLSIVHKGLHGRARVVWRGGGEIGVSFVGRPPQPPASNVVPLDWARRLKDAEADKAALRRRIDQLTSAVE
jgi:hypothetical protein